MRRDTRRDMSPAPRRNVTGQVTEHKRGPPRHTPAGLSTNRQAPGGTREGRPAPRVSVYPPTSASAASTPPTAVHTHRSDHHPEDQPSSGSMADSTAESDELSSSASDLSESDTTAMPGTSGFAREPSTAAEPPMSFESTRTSV